MIRRSPSNSVDQIPQHPRLMGALDLQPPADPAILIGDLRGNLRGGAAKDSDER
jgi:hypothetical protein